MYVFKLLKLLTIIGSVGVLACSPKATDNTTSHSEVQPAVSANGVFQGIHAYKDPKTGEFLQTPPNTNTTQQPNTANSNTAAAAPTAVPSSATHDNNSRNTEYIMNIPAPYRSNNSSPSNQ